ncbi:MAG: glycine oxidase ThiO [Gammaproteobacteria bacterium]|nr:glycine oxidase ThiO [Gammaproteobacteria bacterium]
MHVTVIGAGVAGLACAVELAERGARVEVIEQGEKLGSSCCSWYAGGMLAPWCELESAEPLVARLGAESLAWWLERVPGACNGVGNDAPGDVHHGTQINGSLVIAHGRDAGELAQFARRTERFEWLDGEALAALEPDLGGRFSRALFFREEGHLDPRAALVALARRLGELGVPIRFGVSAAATQSMQTDLSNAQQFRPRPPRGDCVIDCTGLAARAVLKDLRGVKGEMLLLRLREISLSRPVRVLHPRIPLYIVPRADGLFMVGATMLESDQPTRITARSMLELLSAAYALHPAFGEAEILEIGTGVRPAFPDNLPRIGWHGGTLYVNGLFRHGFLLAPALARRAAQIVLEERYFPEVQGENPRERRLA